MLPDDYVSEQWSQAGEERSFGFVFMDRERVSHWRKVCNEQVVLKAILED